MRSAFLAVFILVALPLTADSSGLEDDCTYDGIPLFGRVQFVESFADLTVQVVDAFADLRVQMVDAFPDECGKWQEVDSFPAFTVQIVNDFPDLTIEFVDAFPGIGEDDEGEDAADDDTSLDDPVEQTEADDGAGCRC